MKSSSVERTPVRFHPMWWMDDEGGNKGTRADPRPVISSGSPLCQYLALARRDGLSRLTRIPLPTLLALSLSLSFNVWLADVGRMPRKRLPRWLVKCYGGGSLCVGTTRTSVSGAGRLDSFEGYIAVEVVSLWNYLDLGWRRKEGRGVPV